MVFSKTINSVGFPHFIRFSRIKTQETQVLKILLKDMSDTNLDCLLLSSLFHNNVCRSKNQAKFTKKGKNFKKKPRTMHFIKLIMLFHEPYILISFLIMRIECYYRAWFVIIVIIHMLLYHQTKKIRKERKCISTTNGMHNYMDGIPDQ